MGENSTTFIKLIICDFTQFESCAAWGFRQWSLWDAQREGKKKTKNNKNWCVLLVRKHKSIFSSCTMLKRVRHGHTVQINFSFQCSVWQASSSEQWNPALFALPWISVSLGCCCYRILKRPFVIRNKWFKSTKKCRVLAAWLGTTYW